MFGERCTLCGGKLDGRKICTECGLNNSKSEKNYKINKGSCDGQPMTHVHEEEKGQQTYRQADTAQQTYRQADTAQQTYRQADTTQQTYRQADTAQQTYRQADTGTGNSGQKEKTAWKKGMAAKPRSRQKKAGWAARAATAFVVVSILGTIIGSVADIWAEESFFEDSDENYEKPYPYQQLSDMGVNLPKEGSDEDFTLPSGKYIVGVHIPAGNYYADVTNDYDSVQVVDDEHSIYLYEYQAQEGDSYLNDLRLFDGALVEISTSDTVCLITENAQTVSSIENPLTETYEFSDNTEKTAGVDFEAGFYDLYANEGWGSVNVKIDSMETGIVLGEDAPDGMEYRNVFLPEGSKIVIEDNSDGIEDSLHMTMVPSPHIPSEDDVQTYEDYYN